MKKLLLLQLQDENNPQPIKRLNRFSEIAAEHEMHLQPLYYRLISGAKYDESHLHSQIDGAHGFVITSSQLLENQKIGQSVLAKIKSGAITFADLPPPSDRTEPGDIFFQELGIEPTSIRANCNRGGSTVQEGAHPTLLEYHRSGYEYGFRDAELFKNVSSVVLQQPNGLGCFGDTKSILSLPLDEISLIDMRSDRFVDGLSRPEFPIMGVCSKNDWTGRLIASTAGFCHDPYQNMFGFTFPGITGGDNERLTRNIVKVISDGFSAIAYNWEYAYSLMSEIEKNILELTRKELVRKFGDSWFIDSCPEDIRSKCMERAGGSFRDHPYIFLDLIDFKAIWKSNWHLFSNLFSDSPDQVQGKGSALKFMQELNEIRKVVAHPIRQLNNELKIPTANIINFLQDTLQRFKDINKGAATR